MAAVEATADGGATWHALALTAWGSWGKALDVPAGASVQVRITGSDGTKVTSPAWAWPPA